MRSKSHRATVLGRMSVVHLGYLQKKKKSSLFVGTLQDVDNNASSLCMLMLGGQSTLIFIQFYKHLYFKGSWE